MIGGPISGAKTLSVKLVLKLLPRNKPTKTRVCSLPGTSAFTLDALVKCLSLIPSFH